MRASVGGDDRAEGAVGAVVVAVNDAAIVESGRDRRQRNKKSRVIRPSKERIAAPGQLKEKGYRLKPTASVRLRHELSQKRRGREEPTNRLLVGEQRRQSLVVDLAVGNFGQLGV